MCAEPSKILTKSRRASKMSIPILSRKGPLRGHFGCFSRVLGPSELHVDWPPTANEEVMPYFAPFGVGTRVVARRPRAMSWRPWKSGPCSAGREPRSPRPRRIYPP